MPKLPHGRVAGLIQALYLLLLEYLRSAFLRRPWGLVGRGLTLARLTVVVLDAAVTRTQGRERPAGRSTCCERSTIVVERTEVMLRKTVNLLAILALLVSSSALGEVWYSCRMDGQVHRSCCCETEQDRPTNATPALDCPGCCTVYTTSTQAQQARTESKPVAPEANSAIAIASSLDEVTRGTTARCTIYPETRMSRLGPPAFLRFCNFRI